MSLALATRGLRKSYGSRLALDGLDLNVPTGVVYGFLGPSGAGKTTTMRVLTGLVHPDGGEIEMFGRPFDRRDRRRLFDVGALDPGALSIGTALFLVVVWLVGSLVVAAGFSERAEITG